MSTRVQAPHAHECTSVGASQVAFYREHGYLVVRDLLTTAELQAVRDVTDRIVDASRSVTRHDDVYDLEDDHSAATPRVRRIKTPHKHDAVYAALVRHPRILAALSPLLGSAIRLHGTKLNIKAAEFGSPVEWHQDWAFYPHTNDDVLATGIYLDDCDMENGPLLVLPGSHRGPTLDHHADGRFCGAVAPDAPGLDLARAVALTGGAGSMTIHHVRLLHGSAPNRSARPRRLLLFEYSAADAWPLLGVSDFQEFNARLVSGEPTIEARVVPAPIRMPFPPAANQGSIYENQRAARRYRFTSPRA